MSSSELAICIVSHNAYGAMRGGRTGHIGGVERQTSLMARWLARRGHRVSMLTWDEGQEDEELVDGVRVIKICRQDAGARGLRFFHPRWTSLNAGMARAGADLYYHNCAEYVTGQVALWCRRHGRKFVFSVACELDCDKRLPRMDVRERLLYRYALRHADRIIVQTGRQQAMLRESFGLSSCMIPMPCCAEGDRVPVPAVRAAAEARRVLWAGRLSAEKRLEWLLDLASILKEVDFDVVGFGPETPYVRELQHRSLELSNVRLHGRVPFDQMPDYYRRADCLCCTSAYEGFPNTFLEAWSFGRPVVSTFDPDGLIASRKLGAVAKDVPGLAGALRHLLGSPDEWRTASQNARRYYEENHTVDAVVPRFEGLFREVCDGGRSCPDGRNQAGLVATKEPGV